MRLADLCKVGPLPVSSLCSCPGALSAKLSVFSTSLGSSVVRCKCPSVRGITPCRVTLIADHTFWGLIPARLALCQFESSDVLLMEFFGALFESLITLLGWR